MITTPFVTVESLLACMEPEERCTRAEIIRRLDAGLASVQHTLSLCVSQGLLRRSARERCYVWWKPDAAGRPVSTTSFVAMSGYDEELQRLAALSMAARPPVLPGLTVRYGVGLS
jgi:hypothetical protein